MPTEIRVLSTFPTPLVTTTLPEINNEKLTRIIYALRDAGFTYSGPRVPGESTHNNDAKGDSNGRRRRGPTLR